MNDIYNFLIVCVILVIMVFVILYYYWNQPKTISDYKLQFLDGSVEKLKMDWCLSETLPSLSCYGQGRGIIYQRPVFHRLQPINQMVLSQMDEKMCPGWYLGARPFSSKDALVIYGNIPNECLYWGITGYLFDEEKQTFSPINDSVSSESVDEKSPRQGVAAILTSNPLMFHSVKKVIERRWETLNKPYSIQIFPIYIPKLLVNDRARFFMMVHSLMINEHTPPPKWSTVLFRSQDIPEKFVKSIEPNYPPEKHSETEVQTQKQWDEMCSQFCQKYSHSELIPVDFKPEKSISRDMTHFESSDIVLTKGKKIVVIAVDHCLTEKSSLSVITFQDCHKNYTFDYKITGHKMYPRKKNQGPFNIHVIECNPWKDYTQKETLTVRVCELVHCEPSTLIGPNSKSVLKMNVFVVDN